MDKKVLDNISSGRRGVIRWASLENTVIGGKSYKTLFPSTDYVREHYISVNHVGEVSEVTTMEGK